MNILPINNIDSNSTSFRSVKVLGRASKEVKEMIYSSALKDAKQDFLVLIKDCTVSPYDYNHAAGTKLYELKLVKKPESLWQKMLLRLGLIQGEYITDGYRSPERGIAEALSDKHIKSVIKRLG